MLMMVIPERLSEPDLMEMSAFDKGVMSVSPVKLISSREVCVADVVSMNCPLFTATVSVEIVTVVLAP